MLKKRTNTSQFIILQCMEFVPHTREPQNMVTFKCDKMMHICMY